MPKALGRHSSCQHLSQMEPGSLRIGPLRSGPGRRGFGWGLRYDSNEVAFEITTGQCLVGFRLQGAFKDKDNLAFTARTHLGLRVLPGFSLQGQGI